MADVAVNLPLSGSEIREIIVTRLDDKIAANSLLADSLAYGGFDYDLTLNIRLHGLAEQKTLVWDKESRGEKGESPVLDATSESYQSEAPNVERQKHDLPLTVETQDGKGRKSFKKVRVAAQ